MLISKSNKIVVISDFGERLELDAKTNKFTMVEMVKKGIPILYTCSSLYNSVMFTATYKGKTITKVHNSRSYIVTEKDNKIKFVIGGRFIKLGSIFEQFRKPTTINFVSNTLTDSQNVIHRLKDFKKLYYLPIRRNSVDFSAVIYLSEKIYFSLGGTLKKIPGDSLHIVANKNEYLIVINEIEKSLPKCN